MIDRRKFMRKNNKGFTLIELLAVIVVLAIIIIIATINVNKQIKKSRENANVISMNAIKRAAKTCMLENNDDKDSCSSVTGLIEDGYLNDFEDPYDKNNDDLDSTYIITFDDKTNSVYVSDVRHDIYLSNLKLVRKNGNASVVDTPNISEKSINNFGVEVKNPGDEVVYSFEIVNKTENDVKLSDINDFELFIYKVAASKNPDLKYDLNGDGVVTSADASAIYSKLKFGLYNDDEKTKISKEENIESGHSKTVKIIVSVKENASSFKNVIKIYDKASLTLAFEIVNTKF